MKKVTYFDVEYANSKNKSICQLGLVCENFEDSESIFPEMDIYINPEDRFDDMCIKVHGITESKVLSSPSFPVVWNDIEKYFTNSIIVGHNVAVADLDALVKCLKRYNLDIPELYYICTLELAREYVPRFAVENYSMSALCRYFDIDIDIDSEHNAFDDACANSDLFKTLVRTYNIDLERHIKKYIPKETKQFSQFISSPALRKEISEFYGVIRGFSIDNTISDSEADYITAWRSEHIQYSDLKEVRAINTIIEKIVADGIITLDEIVDLQFVVKSYLDMVSTSPITLATQILDGILKGIIADGTITERECKNLRQWLYDNIYLSDHYPFNKAMSLLEKVLADSVITADESVYLTTAIAEMLNPVESLKAQIYCLENMHVCLSGNFSYGQKSDVERYVLDNHGLIDANVKKTTNYLVVGDCECLAYSNGTYGTKVKKAIEYNEKGCNIQIVKEKDFFAGTSKQ